MFAPLDGADDVASLSSERLEEGIVDLASRIAAATCRWLQLVVEFERRGAHEEQGFHCCATWLAWRCSIAPRSAREYLRVARCLVGLPLIRDAMARGELTYSKVRVLTRVATPKLESELVQLARHATAAQLERVARAYGRAMSAEDAERAHERRHLTYEWEDDGSLSIRGTLCAEDGALLLRALEAGREEIRDSEAPASGPSEPHRARGPVNADALVLMAETLLAGGAACRAAGERAQVVVHVDAGALTGDREEGPSRCELEDGAPVSPETARRLACDSSRVRMTEGADGPLDVGRKTRTVPPAMRRALGSRDGGCRFPGCTHRRWTDAHHIRHWADGGKTSQENLVSLCRRHHRLVHEGRFGVDRDSDGELRFWRPDGELLPRSPGLDRRDSRHGGRRRIAALHPVGGSAEPLSAGDRMDLELTVELLCARSDSLARAP